MTKFVNVLVPVFHKDHAQAVVNEAERLGWKWCPQYNTSGKKKLENSLVVHLQGNGLMFAYECFHADGLEGAPNDPDGIYKDAVILKKLRKLRGMMEALNNPVLTESQDNMAVLSVIERPKYDIVTTQPVAERNLLGTGMILAPYGSSEFPDCVCLGVDANARKTCRMGKAYGGGCQLERATKADYDNVVPDAPVKFVRPDAENPVVTRVVRFLAVAGTKVLGLIKRAYKHIRGGL